MLESAAGRLLVATPLLNDPNFERTVVLVCFHDANGAFGIVLNRPVEALAAHLVPDWHGLISPPGTLHAGGPVERSSFLGVGLMEEPQDEPEWWTALARGRPGPGLGLVNLAADPEEAARLDALRIFHGYAGWGAGQLDMEIGEDAWFLVDAHPLDPFAAEPEALWRDVLLRQRGDLAMYGWYPEDARLN
ncbi:MAG: YqgE/AlgH family protein [Dehalococcoidia bacterium]|nr:YqgE/AlgH family protein [Dehalococcoidia bacterium]